MAATAAGAALTEAHRLAQARLSAQTVAQLLQVWPLLDPANLDATAPRWLTAARPIVANQHAQSVALAREYQRQFRAVELSAPITAFDPPAAPTLAVEALTTSLLVQGPIAIKAAMTAGQALATATETASAASAATGSRFALNGGRDMVAACTAADPRAKGVRRVTSPGCCAFCAMLAARSADGLSADFFKAHDACHCQPETAYSGGVQDATRQAKEFHALYVETASGKSDALNVFRQALSAQRGV